MDSPWRWTLFSVFIITSQNNVHVWAQNVVPSRPLPQLPNQRENDCPGTQGGSTPQINNIRNFEKGPESPQKMQTESSRPPMFPESRLPMPNVLRLPIETMATGSRPCPPSSAPVQSNLFPLQSSPLPPRIPNLFSLPREQMQSNPKSNIPPVANLPVPQREQCPQCSQDVLPQQTPNIIPQPSRLPSPLFSSRNPFKFFNSNLPPSEPLAPTLPVMPPQVPLKESVTQNNIVSPYPSPFVPNNLIGSIESVSTLPVSPPCNDAPYGPTNTLPPSLPPSPSPNFPPPFLPLNPFRSFLFGPNSIPKPTLNTVPPCPAENRVSSCPFENLSGQNPPPNTITSPSAITTQTLNNGLRPLDVTHSLAFPSGQQVNFNAPLQQNSLIPPQQCPINNAPILPKTSCLQSSAVPIPVSPTPANVFNNINPQPAPLLPAAYPPLIPPLNLQPPCTLATDLSSIGFLPTQRNSFNGLPTIPTNVPVYQTTVLPPVVTGPINNVPQPISKIQEVPIPITLQVNMPPIPAPKIILVAPPPSPPAPVIEENANAVELFEPYPLPPIIIEGRRSRYKSWLPLILVALFTGDGCGCGGGCCDCNSGPTMVPYPMPVPTNNPVVFN